MRSFAWLVLFVSVLASSVASAEPRQLLGTGRLFSNDYLGDNQDRWRTGSYVVSKIRGYRWEGARPSQPGELIEYRFRAEMIAPEDIRTPSAGDRRFAGVLSFGVHTHFETQLAEMSIGGDMVITGPQTGVAWLQREVHDLVDAPRPLVHGNQIPNGFHPTLTLEAGRVLRFSEGASLRPFVEVRAGAETLVRGGFDLHFGRVGRGELLLRDVTTGHLYRGTRGTETGLAAIIGADWAHVEHSVYLPVYDGYQVTDRTRVRAGLHWQGKQHGVFYGVTWLGPEFAAQDEGQVVGSLRLDIKF